ncbi:hypothetical protein [Bradyrhizobium sp. HKCCYLS20291]|uniref:hypothetical protein n=1 Tax=Bradyrhizobium sp. HKCCYLS20291 TaxID=3420766 RepID=UPI003EC14300
MDSDKAQGFYFFQKAKLRLFRRSRAAAEFATAAPNPFVPTFFYVATALRM